MDAVGDGGEGEEGVGWEEGEDVYYNLLRLSAGEFRDLRSVVTSLGRFPIPVGDSNAILIRRMMDVRFTIRKLGG